MKKFITLFLFFLLSASVCYPQGWHASAVRLTSGITDRNPTFRLNKSRENKPWEFMAFERVTGSSVNVFVTQIGVNGPLDSGLNLSNNSFVNINPSVAYYSTGSFSYGLTRHAMIIWERIENGDGDIFARYYTHSSGWSPVLAVDTSSSNQSSPDIYSIDSTRYAITYASGDDIIFKIFTTDGNAYLRDTCITLADTAKCSNPAIKVSNKIGISYERRITATRNAVYLRINDYNFNNAWTTPDTIAYAGNNKNAGFTPLNTELKCIFESNRSGRWGIYEGTPSSQSSILVNNFDNTDYVKTDYIITDNLFPPEGYIRTFAGTEAYIVPIWGPTITLTINDGVSPDHKMTINSGVYYPFCYRYWFTFDKDSTLPYDIPPGIYGVPQNNCIDNITNNGELTRFALHQNYPNPFNPATKIKFEVPYFSFASLKIYDVSGKEVAVIVSERLPAGIHEYEWNAGGIPSGIYFYKLRAEGYISIKKMMLVK